MTNTALITDPVGVMVYLIGLIAVIYWARAQPGLSKIFKYLPPVIWVYFLPMFSTTLGITPAGSPLYDFVKLNLLPAALILLLLSSNTRELVKLGPKALGTMLFGTLGIVIGGVVALVIFSHWLPPDAWKGMGALSGSWIGGSANMVAIGTSIGTRDDLFGIMIIVDTLVGYGWMGIVIFLSGYQDRIDKWNGVDSSHIDEMDERLQAVGQARRRPIRFKDLSLMVFIGLGFGYLSLKAGNYLPNLGSVITSFAWTIIIVSIIGLVLSLTRLAELEFAGASHVGNLFLFLLLATIGAKADLQAITRAPVFLLAGVVWILIHAVILFFGGKLLKAPMFLIATSSQANVGGVVSAPIVASVYRKSLAPVGLLLGVVGNILGIYFGLLTAQLMSWLAGI